MAKQRLLIPEPTKILVDGVEGDIMSLVIELITNAATTLSLGGGLWFINNKYKSKPKSKLETFGVYTWAAMNRLDKFQCPKCECKIKGQPPICFCHEYHLEHFHFKCEGHPPNCCGYSCIIRAKDDVD